MKDINTKINESITKTDYSEWHDIICKKDLTIERKEGNITFKSNTEYKASKINDNWWLIDQVGVKNDDFKKYFKDI